MRITQYLAQEKAIAAADTNTIRERWIFGLRILRDPEAMSPGGGGLRHGVAPRLVAEAKARGFALSEREIRWRIQAARTYPTESQIGNAVTDFRSWRNLISAGFPSYDAAPDEPLADHRTEAEKRRDADRRLLDLVGPQGTLFPLDQIEPTEAPLKDLVEYADRQDALTERFAAHGRKRREYLDRLINAVDGDLSRVWQDAHRLAYSEDIA
jgi:hypothetical protein